MEIILKEKLLNDFKKALADKKIIYLKAATGFGKTLFLKTALKNTAYDYYSLRDNYNFIDSKKKIVVIDDFQYIVDNMHLLKSINKLLEKDICLIISSRASAMNYFLIPNSLKGTLEIKEEDLALTYNEVEPLFKKINIPEETIKDIIYAAQNCNLLVSITYDKLAKENEYNRELKMEIYNEYCEHLKNNVFDYMDQNVLRFLVQVSVVDEFSVELGNAITLSDNAKFLANKAISYGNFMTYKNGIYTIRDFMLYSLRRLSYLYYSLSEYNDYRYNAGVYYEKNNQTLKALQQYEECNAIGRIKAILIANSYKNPEDGQYVQFEKYYEMLSNDDLKANPILISGLAMVYGINLNISKSNYYYELLKTVAGSAKGQEKRMLDSQIKYLDIALPQTGTKDIFNKILSNTSDGVSGSIVPCGFSLTSNLPSIINGGKDFIPFIKDGNEILTKYGNCLTYLMGESKSQGLLSTIYLEIFFEEGDYMKAFSYLTKAQMEAGKQNYNIYFVTIRIEIMLALISGNIKQAENIYQKFTEYIKDSANTELLQNAYALKTVINIFSKNDSEITSWLRITPDERKSFYTTYRYIYLVKCIAYIYLKRYDDAMLLLGKLDYYASVYNRPYLDIQIKLLRSIICFLSENEYYSDFIYALKKTNEYRLVSVISIFGATIYEMLEMNRKHVEEEIKDKQWLNIINSSLLNMKSRYPDFLYENENIIPSLSEKGLDILRLQALGLSLNQIADKLNENLETVRYHAKQNYKKLGASGKADAVMLAKKYKIM